MGVSLNTSLFDKFKDGLLALDPVVFCEKWLTLDGKPFRLNGNGYKPFADIYRYIGITALQPNSLPVIFVKGRQVGATTMAAALELFFMTCGLFGSGGRSPMRVMHAFPLLDIAYTYTKTKLNSMISTAIPDPTLRRGKTISYVESNLDKAAAANDSLQFKQFINGNHIQIESTGIDANRLRGRTVDAIFFDECFPYEQYIETKNGKEKIGVLYEIWEDNKQMRGHGAASELPLVKTFNESTNEFEYKKIIKAWKRKPHSLIQLTCGNREVRCTTNHRFLTEDGWKRADQMQVGELIKMAPFTKLRVRSLNDDQMQIALGSFLGDGNLSKQKNNRYRLRVIHGISQSDYCNWKAAQFNCNTENILKNGYSQKPAIKFVSKIFGLKNELPKTKSTCPQWVLDQLDARGLAIWFMDDGAVNNKINACISTCSFDEESQARIVKKLKSMGIDCRYAFYKSRSKKNGYYSIYLKKNGFLKLCEIISPYMHENMQYKLHPKYVCKNKYKWNAEFNPYTLTVLDKITYLKDEQTVYDIGVEDNHNFIVTSSGASKNLGGLIAHNCQDISGAAIANAIQILSKAQYGPPTEGIQVYFGTPKQKGTTYWDIWRASSQQYFFLGCENCGEHFPLYTPESNDWESIWIEDSIPKDYIDPKTNLKPHGFIVKCTHCEHQQDKRPAADRGRWVSMMDDESQAKFIGFHLNQLYMPDTPRDKIIAKKPENSEIYTERAYQNEVLGEFFAGDSTPITPEEIELYCADKSRGFRSGISTSEGKKSYAGLDWGQKIDADQLVIGDRERKSQGQSYSSCVVLTVETPTILSIDFARLLKRNDFEYKKAFVDEIFRRYSIERAVGDIGFANDLTEVLHRDFGERFLASRAVSKVKHHIKFNTDVFPQEILFERNFYIAELFDKMKKGEIRFPYKHYEQIGWLVQHCTSMEIKPTIDRTGNLLVRYVKGSTPNDGFMALLNAYLAYKFDVTGGFNIQNPNQHKDPMDPGGPPVLLGHLPRMNPLKR